MVINNNCKNCGGNVVYDPKKQKLVCLYCKSEHEITIAKTNKKKELKDIDLYHCPDCGAEILTKNNELSTFCVYCRSNSIIKGSIKGKYYPDIIIPFKKTKEDAIKAFENIQKSQKLLPEEFLDKANIEEIRGVYIPFWLMDIDIQGKMTANTKATKIVDEFEEGRYKIHKKEYNNNREGNISYKMVPIDASTHFNDTIMQNIEPFNYDEAKEYSHDYLFGYLAEVYDVAPEKALEEANERVKKSAYEIFRKSLVGGSPVEIEVKNFECNSSIIEKKYALLPVYMLNIKYNNKIYVFAMNGQTGNITGDLPSSKIKEIIYYIVAVLTSLIFLLPFYVLLYQQNEMLRIFLLIIPFIIARIFLKYEKEKYKSLHKNKEINHYIDDRFVETRKDELKKEVVITHETSRAAKVVVPIATFGITVLSALASGTRKK